MAETSGSNSNREIDTDIGFGSTFRETSTEFGFSSINIDTEFNRRIDAEIAASSNTNTEMDTETVVSNTNRETETEICVSNTNSEIETEIDVRKAIIEFNTDTVVLLEKQSAAYMKLLEDLEVAATGLPPIDKGETSSAKNMESNHGDGPCGDMKEEKSSTAPEENNGEGQDAKDEADSGHQEVQLPGTAISFPELETAVKLVPIYLSLLAKFLKFLLSIEEKVTIEIKLKELRNKIESIKTADVDPERKIKVGLTSVLDMVDKRAGKPENERRYYVDSVPIDYFIWEFPANVCALLVCLRNLFNEGQPSDYNIVKEECEKALQELELTIKKLVMPEE